MSSTSQSGNGAEVTSPIQKSEVTSPPPSTPSGGGNGQLNPRASIFTPIIGRRSPKPLSPDLVDPRLRRRSLAAFKWPKGLNNPYGIPMNSNLSLFQDEDRDFLRMLILEGQAHLFEHWEGLQKYKGCDEKKKNLVASLKKLDSSYPGGISAYLASARSLLADAADGKNPLEGWTPEVPKGAELTPGTPDFKAKEARGMKELGKVGFVLVAGGLGERLGYSNIKIGLPTESTTGLTYIELYCRQIKALQSRYCEGGDKLALAIMVSGDTVSGTTELLKANDNFGIEITLMTQEKVLALSDSTAKIAMVSPYEVESKPHGHGDVHMLMHSSGTAKKWAQEGKKWLAFFQDTNGLAFTTLAAVLGVSASLDLDVNSVCVPRVAKQAVGAIAKLSRKDSEKTMTVNVEYNQLDPLLRATINPEGDVNDPDTGKSVFPGNINQLIFSLAPYCEVLDQTQGIMGEFVNPKYTDATKTAFKKPTRLECMMQDYAKVLDGDKAERVGFTMFPGWICYSPCKNNAEDAAVAVKKGVPGGCAWTAESDQYFAQAEIMRHCGCGVEKGKDREFLGIPACAGPCVVIDASTAIFSSEYAKVFPYPNRIKISARSTLVLEGNVVVENLDLDGALVAKAAPGHSLRVVAYGEAGRVVNEGHVFEEIDTSDLAAAKSPAAKSANVKVPEITAMRGFTIKKEGETVIDTTTVEDTGDNSAFVYSGGAIVMDHLYEEENKSTFSCFC
jgi:UDP-sugar pyrophosphorylase